ncbi:hypothetical protein ACIBAC_00140 [Streptomyces sp. NPDC051362]|uniref:hypothetical protein n=1 Tax=Streptomyces sp. NPDC051362 TaxID=3365651 RepID=UPI00379CCA17
MTGTEKKWTDLPALIDFSGGYELWRVEMLVRMAGSRKAGLRIIESIEQHLAENNIGHLPTRLPTDGTCRVLLYNKDRPNLGYVLGMIHRLATEEVDENTNGTAHSLKTMLDGISEAFQPNARKEASAREVARREAVETAGTA